MCEIFDAETENGERMDAYSHLLARAVQAIVEQFSRRSFGSLLSNRNAKLTGAAKRIKGMDDFELITWLVIKQEAKNG